MKRLICTILALCLLLCACGTKSAGPAEPAETAAPAASAETTVPAAPTETTAPAETTEPVVSAETTAPDAPVETTIPAAPAPEADTSAPAADDSYTLHIDDPETMIYAGPSFRQDVARLVEEAGIYTIVEEATDADGNTWGRLKSGAGWICLTVPALAPIYADYAEESFNAYHTYWSDETDYITAIGFTPGEKLTDVKFGLMEWFETESWQMAEVLYTMDELDPDHCFLAHVAFWGDMTAYGISFTDADGQPRHYVLSISGKDGSLICSEYLP